MGLKCFLVLTFMIHSGFALSCHNVFNVDKTTCDECIRCGGIWCMNPEEKKQCKKEMEAKDGWCPGHKYEINSSTDSSKPSHQGGIFMDAYIEKTVQPVTNPPYIQLPFNLPLTKGGIPKPRHEFVNNKHQEHIKIHGEVHQDAGKYVLDIATTIAPEICSPDSKFEDVFVKVGVTGIGESVTIKYHVICACDCSGTVEEDSLTCYKNGNLTCGACTCRDEWKGNVCQDKKCPPRGDVSPSCTRRDSSNNVCYGNGMCDNCNKCQCYNDQDTQGSQYFDPENDCIDLCTVIREHDCLFECLRNNQEGPCENPEYPGLCVKAQIQKWNVSFLEEPYKNEPLRKLWVNCSVTMESGVLEYSATKIMSTIYMMRKDTGTSGAIVAGPGHGATIPVVIGVIAALAAMVAAAAGYMAWKGKGALPMTGSNYSNIEAENAVVENPLYKCPTSQFKNPMFGKS